MSDRTRILLGTPVAGEQAAVSYLHTVLNLYRHAMRVGWELEISHRSDGLVTRSRNAFASQVVADESFTHLLMIDSDVSFDPAVVERLVTSGYPVVGACVPLRHVRWDRVAQLANAAPNPSPQDLAAISHSFAVTFSEGAHARANNGFLPADFVGSAVMLISRDALVTVAQSDQVQRYQPTGWTFFDPFVDDRGTYLSEDYAFCQRWRNLGGTVFADPSATITHTGPVAVTGKLNDTLAVVTSMGS